MHKTVVFVSVSNVKKKKKKYILQIPGKNVLEYTTRFCQNTMVDV